MNPQNNIFSNTEIAFIHLSDKELKRSHCLFQLFSSPFLVRVGIYCTEAAFKIGLPIQSLVKATIFKQFCGGETLEECNHSTEQLAKYNVKSLLDYSVEGAENEATFEKTAQEIITTVNNAARNKNIPFAVFKVTGLCSISTLQKVQFNEELSAAEQDEWEKVQNRVRQICQTAYQCKIPVLIDAEESWIQETIDSLALQMMKIYNRERVLIYNTAQLYRNDKPAYLSELLEQAKKEGFKVGMKIVRGAYMEKEANYARAKNIKSVICESKEACDNAYNQAVSLCLNNIDHCAVVIGTHNENSCLEAMQNMETLHIPKNDTRVYFSQLMGMSNNLSFNLAQNGYNVVKYVPYGPVKSVFPYLSRRAQENMAIAGQMGRELSLIKKEIQRRRL